jgi:mono/diheme cytochrome c family protein
MKIFILLSTLMLSLSFAQSRGESIYTTNCLACHQSEGQGIPSLFPPLAQHLPLVFELEGGREYLSKVLVYGLQGSINIDSQTYNGVMPAWPQLTDEDIAEVLNYALKAWGNDTLLSTDFVAITTDEVAMARAQILTPAEVYTLREALDFP